MKPSSSLGHLGYNPIGFIILIIELNGDELGLSWIQVYAILILGKVSAILCYNLDTFLYTTTMYKLLKP